MGRGKGGNDQQWLGGFTLGKLRAEIDRLNSAVGEFPFKKGRQGLRRTLQAMREELVKRTSRKTAGEKISSRG